LLVCLLSACVSEQRYDALEQKYETMERQLSAEIAADQVTITRLQGELKVTLKDEILFPEGGWQLNPQAKATLGKIVPSLIGLQQTRIVVNGYTDNVPIGPELKQMGIESNLELSSRRADTVVAFLQAQGVNPNLLSAQGFGETHPVASNDTPEGRAQNRRIEVTLVGPGT
jgi:Flagellar motor protein